MSRARALVLAFLSLSLASQAQAQVAPVSLLVIDDATDTAVPDVRVSVVGEPREGVTDARGRYVYVPRGPGRVIVVLRRLGYQPGTLTIEVQDADTSRVTYAMSHTLQTLSTITVREVARSSSPVLAGFERRAANKAGSATYIMRDEIDKAHANRVTDLLRRTSSLTVADSGFAQIVKGKRSGCTVQIGVDGELRYAFPINTLAPEDLHGIEIYPGPATIPAEYASMLGNSKCGLIMFWTRRGK